SAAKLSSTERRKVQPESAVTSASSRITSRSSSSPSRIRSIMASVAREPGELDVERRAHRRPVGDAKGAAEPLDDRSRHAEAEVGGRQGVASFVLDEQRDAVLARPELEAQR